MWWTDFVTLFVFCKPIALLTLEWSCQMDWKRDILNYKNNPHMNNEWTHTLHIWKGKSKWKCSYSKHTPLVSTFKRLDDKRMPFYLNWNWSFHFPFLLDLLYVCEMFGAWGVTEINNNGNAQTHCYCLLHDRHHQEASLCQFRGSWGWGWGLKRCTDKTH